MFCFKVTAWWIVGYSLKSRRQIEDVLKSVNQYCVEIQQYKLLDRLYVNCFLEVVVTRIVNGLTC